jgi:predicted CoA-binding protein
MSEIKDILSKHKTIAMIGVSKDPKKTINHSYEVYAKIWI